MSTLDCVFQLGHHASPVVLALHAGLRAQSIRASRHVRLWPWLVASAAQDWGCWLWSTSRVHNTYLLFAPNVVARERGVPPRLVYSPECWTITCSRSYVAAAPGRSFALKTRWVTLSALSAPFTSTLFILSPPESPCLSSRAGFSSAPKLPVRRP